MKARFTDAAELDIAEAFDWYEQKQPGLGFDSWHEVRETVRRIEAAPDHFGSYEGCKTKKEVRRALTKRYPYVTIFEVTSAEIVVHAVVHAAKAPGSWERR